MANQGQGLLSSPRDTSGEGSGSLGVQFAVPNRATQVDPGHGKPMVPAFQSAAAQPVAAQSAAAHDHSHHKNDAYHGLPLPPFYRHYYEDGTRAPFLRYRGEVPPSANPTVRAHDPIPPPPSPLRGTPQDRFRTAVLGLPPKPFKVGEAPPLNTEPHIRGQHIPPVPPGPSRPGLLPRPQPAYPSGSGRTPPHGTLSYDDIKSSPGSSHPDAPLLRQGGTLLHLPAVPSPAMLLSTECQKRGFNPQWTAGEMRGGMFQCSVNLNGREIGPGPAFFATFEEAKREMASKALDIVKTWPVTKAPKPATQNVQTATQPPMQPATQSRARGQDLAGLLKSVQKSNASLRQGKRKAKQAKAAKAANSGNGSRTGHVARATAGEHANLQKIKQEEGVEQRLKVPKIVKDSGTTGHAAKGNGREKTSGEKTSRVLEEVQSLIGTTFPDNFNEDPRIATTFLEGLALGSRLAESVAKNSQLRDGSQAHDQTGRSPNRDALRLRSYRSRSPVRGRDRESDRRWRDHGEQRRSSYYRPYQDHHSPRRHSRRTRSRSPAESRTYQDHHRRDSFASSDVASRGTDRGVARRVERGVEPSRTTASGPSVPPKSQGKTKDLRQGSGLQY